jgi:hypothetical protein
LAIFAFAAIAVFWSPPIERRRSDQLMTNAMTEQCEYFQGNLKG